MEAGVGVGFRNEARMEDGGWRMEAGVGVGSRNGARMEDGVADQRGGWDGAAGRD
jgi:hypothetical protein